MQKFISHSTDETQKLAEQLAKKYQSGAVITLSGELGAGKTTFVQGFAKGLGIKDKIISPTFVLLRQHKIPQTGGILYHIDLYRLENEDEFKALAVEDLTAPKNIILIEWPEKAGSFLPKQTVNINFEITDNETREITLS